MLRTCHAAGVSDAVVAVTQSESTMIRISNDQVTVGDALMETSAFLFISDNGRKAGTTVADLSKRGISSAAKKLVEAAKKGPGGGLYAPLPKGPFHYDQSLLESESVPIDPKRTVAWADEAVKKAKEQGATRVAGSLTAENGRITLQTSGGAFGVSKRGGLEISLRAFNGQGGSGHSVSVAGIEKEFQPGQAGEEAGRLAAMAEEPQKGEPGEYTALLGPMTFANLISHAGRMASAFFVDSGISFLTDKLGMKVASEVLSLWDDPTKAGDYGAAAFDLEGLPTRRTAIIEKGVLASYLHNSATAKKFGVQSTSNAGLVAPHAFNLEIGPGKSSFEDLVSSIDKGIFVSNDWYLRYQSQRTADFSTIPRDAMLTIENGKLARSIKELRISDNLLRMLSGVTSLSKDRKLIKWWEVETPTLAPYAVIEKVKFTRSRM